MGSAPNGRETLHDLILVERGTEVSDAELPTTASLARRHLMRGDRIVGREWAETYGAWKSIITQTVVVLEHMGYEFERERLHRDTPGRHLIAYRCTNPDHVPTEAQIDHAIDMKAEQKTPGKSMKKKPAAKALAEVEVEQPAAPVHNGADESGVLPLPALPGLGQSVSIYALVLNDDDSITVGLRNGTRKWTANLSGVIE
jgi:hypothetical protein